MKVLDRGILHRDHERLPELPDDVTIPDDLSGLELREAADRRRPATAIRWLRWLPLFLLVAVGAIVLSVESTGDDTQTVTPSVIPWEESQGPGSNSLYIPATITSVSPWPAGDGPWSHSVSVPVRIRPAGDGPWSHSLNVTTVAPAEIATAEGSWPAGDGPWTNSLNQRAATLNTVPWADGQGPGSNFLGS